MTKGPAQVFTMYDAQLLIRFIGTNSWSLPSYASQLLKESQWRKRYDVSGSNRGEHRDGAKPLEKWRTLAKVALRYGVSNPIILAGTPY